MTGCDSPFQRQPLFSVISGLRCGVVGDGELTRTASHPIGDRGIVTGIHGHRLPAWLRPGTKWPPGKNRLPLPHLVLGRLRKATSFPATVSTLWFRQHGPACQRARVPIRATGAEAPAAQPRSARLSACGWAYPPGSRADFTPRATGSPASYSALSQALLTMRDRFLSGRRSEAARARHYGRKELSLLWHNHSRGGASGPPSFPQAR